MPAKTLSQALDKGKSLSWVLPQAKIKSPPLKNVSAMLIMHQP